MTSLVIDFTPEESSNLFHVAWSEIFILYGSCRFLFIYSFIMVQSKWFHSLHDNDAHCFSKLEGGRSLSAYIILLDKSKQRCNKGAHGAADQESSSKTRQMRRHSILWSFNRSRRSDAACTATWYKLADGGWLLAIFFASHCFSRLQQLPGCFQNLCLEFLTRTRWKKSLWPNADPKMSWKKSAAYVTRLTLTDADVRTWNSSHFVFWKEKRQKRPVRLHTEQSRVLLLIGSCGHTNLLMFFCSVLSEAFKIRYFFDEGDQAYIAD